MQLCNETITVFNAKYDDATGYDVYIPTVISGVSWYFSAVTTVGSDGLQASDQYTVRIPADADFSGRSYVSPLEFAKAEDSGAVFTLRAGDIIVHAAVSESGLRPKDLQTRYPEMMTVLAITDNRRAPHGGHWKVVGK
jgi:hypothetical protein